MRGPGKVQASGAATPRHDALAAATQGEWHAVVREVMEQAPAPAVEGTGAKPGRRMGVVFAALCVILLVVVAWNVTELRMDRRPAFTGAQVSEGVLASIFLTAMGLERYRARTGAYPTTLETAGLESPDLSYRLEGDRYILTSGVTSPPMSYTSGEDLSPYELALDGVLLSARGGS